MLGKLWQISSCLVLELFLRALFVGRFDDILVNEVDDDTEDDSDAGLNP